jgi:hypothetical protein
MNMQEFEGFLRDCVYGLKCGHIHWRIARRERKLEKLKIKEMNLRIKGWAR